MNIQNYEQTTVESCLVCCLLQLTRQKITREKELGMLFYALKFSKKDFVTGHLDYIKKHIPATTVRYVHNNKLYDWLKDVITTKTIQHKVTLDFIDTLLKKSPVILSIDMWCLSRIFHYPHWILLLKKEGNDYLIYEPQEGMTKKIPTTKLKEGLQLYLCRLWMAPQCITLETS